MKNLTDVAWEHWGKQDPYFGVLTQEKYRRNGITESKGEFFESGERHIADILGELERHFGEIKRTSALDFGSGVGRLLIPLSRRFSEVTGMDVSRSMLAEAATNLRERQIQNVELLESDDDLSRLGSREFDFIHTFIVLQHISPKRGYVIVRNLLNHHLKPDGAFFMHVSFRNIDTSVKGRLPLIRKLVRFVRSHLPYAHILLNIVRGRKISEPAMEMNDYELREMLGIFHDAGVKKLITELEPHGTYLTARFYSRKGCALGR